MIFTHFCHYNILEKVDFVGQKTSFFSYAPRKKYHLFKNFPCRGDYSGPAGDFTGGELLGGEFFEGWEFFVVTKRQMCTRVGGCAQPAHH